MAKSTNKEFTTSRYLATFALATLFFIIGILIGNAITSNKLQNIKSTEENLKLEMSDFNMQAELAEFYPCNNYMLYSLGERLDELGAKIVMLENQLGKSNEFVIELKKPYSLIQIQHYLLIKKRIEKCNENYFIILFFYSNKPEYIRESEKQGYVLTYLADKYGYNRVKVYSIDEELDMGVVKALKEIYGIKTFPSTLLNEKLYVGFHDLEELEKDF